MPTYEVRRFLDLLRMGLEVDYAVELEWAGLEDVADRASLDKCVVVLRIPGDVDPKSIASAQAKLGDVRVGLVLHERAGDWADVDWQQHHIKVPLLSALNRELHMGQHPFAGLGIDALPLDELAKLTAEPVELLEMLDSVIDHRLQHAAQGLASEDWRRSIDLAIADRLAMRLSKIPAAARAAALDLALDARQQPLWPAIDRRYASEALAHVGLAWREGSDVLIGALARQAGEPTVLRRLLTQLTDVSWSKQSRAALAEVMPSLLPLPRAAGVTPEPRYTDWPTMERLEVIRDVHYHIGSRLDTKLRGSFDDFMRRLSESAEWDWPSLEHQEDPWVNVNESPWEAAIDAIDATFLELEDDALMEFDYERGRIHRFDAVDQALEDHPGQNELGALVRWIGVTGLARRTFDHHHFEILTRELEGSIRLVGDETSLRAALMVSLGDLWALRHHHANALHWWAKARDRNPESFGLILRQMLAMLRIGQFGEMWWQLYNDSEFFDYRSKDENTQYENEVAQVIQLLSGQDPRSRVVGSDPLPSLTLTVTTPSANSSAMLTICRAAVALEREDWPLAIHLLDTIDDTATPPEVARARLLRAWTRAALGDIDLAAATFEEVEQLATRWSDDHLAHLAAHGRAWAASQGSTN